jgi:hypothetical protein
MASQEINWKWVPAFAGMTKLQSFSIKIFLPENKKLNAKFCGDLLGKTQCVGNYIIIFVKIKPSAYT